MYALCCAVSFFSFFFFSSRRRHTRFDCDWSSDVCSSDLTVLDESAARSVIDAGARFVVSPALDPAVIRACRDRAVPCMPGAFTPTELLEAWRAGAPVVKLFPASAVGSAYIRDVLAPLPFLRLVPSGGGSLENAGDWIRAGAAAVSVGSALASAALLAEGSAAELTARARSFVERVAEARRHRGKTP